MDALIRPWNADKDAPSLRAAITCDDPDLARQMAGHGPDDASLVKLFANEYGTPNASHAPFAIVLGGKAVGNVGISAMEDTHLSGWCHYWLLPAARGLGLASRALAAAADWAFAERGLQRLELGHRTNNPASCGVATRAGFQAEGVERGKLLYDGARYDVELHARLHTDPTPELAPLRRKG
ncbi:GNAT family N-acetyltransferase [Galactobacter caseinivorans]|uniref:N-acetyltransferase n=1 Tax=Galactobacter caseinivorans TaxID=2676123 RepID=A0A496PJ52_9MICC|nr:GNAT family protein [Galactobacter caseinivorans]RKW70525.1 N-acetyltransferase [Galactobacter caseinivorans]